MHHSTKHGSTAEAADSLALRCVRFSVKAYQMQQAKYCKDYAVLMPGSMQGYSRSFRAQRLLANLERGCRQQAISHETAGTLCHCGS